MNLSPINFLDVEFTKTVIELIHSDKHEICPIEFEITESMFMKNPDKTIKIINKLRKYGIKFAIDDYGTGFSSLNMLKQIPANILKLDKSFLYESESNRTIVESTIKLAHALELKVVAEGVECTHHLLWLKGINCDYGQGYLFSEALPGLFYY